MNLNLGSPHGLPSSSDVAFGSWLSCFPSVVVVGREVDWHCWKGCWNHNGHVAGYCLHDCMAGFGADLCIASSRGRIRPSTGYQKGECHNFSAGWTCDPRRADAVSALASAGRHSPHRSAPNADFPFSSSKTSEGHSGTAEKAWFKQPGRRCSESRPTSNRRREKLEGTKPGQSCGGRCGHEFLP